MCLCLVKFRVQHMSAAFKNATTYVFYFFILIVTCFPAPAMLICMLGRCRNRNHLYNRGPEGQQPRWPESGVHDCRRVDRYTLDQLRSETGSRFSEHRSHRCVTHTSYTFTKRAPLGSSNTLSHLCNTSSCFKSASTNQPPHQKKTQNRAEHKSP